MGYLVEVAERSCPGESRSAQSDERARVWLNVPRGAGRIPPGFESQGVEAAIERARGEEAPAVPAHAGSPGLAVGSRIRVETAAGVKEGRLAQLDARSLSLRMGDELVRIERERIVAVDAYDGGSHGMKALGFLAGLAGGLALAALYYTAADDAESTAPLYLLTLGGGALGASLTPGERWKPVEAWSAGRFSLGPAPGGGVTGVVTLRF
jgi:hypothetical protein